MSDIEDHYEYKVRPARPGRPNHWSWEVIDRQANRIARRGEAKGARSKAVEAAMRAIDELELKG